MKILRSALAGLVLVSGAASAQAADAFLQSLTGNWRGGGWARQTTGAAREAVRCRLRASEAGNGSRLSISGKCAVGGNSGEVAASITSLGGGRYSGNWTVGGPKIDEAVGRRQGDRLTFKWSTSSNGQGLPRQGRAVWVRGNKRLTIKTFRQGASGAAIGELVLTR